MPKVSVIIPVYGVEKYIERCAHSLFEQTLDDIEYIFVDDCSPDRSIEILKSIIEEYRLRFAEEKKTVRIERMPTNSGQAAVRRHGIQLATGDYIIHCDSDDWVDVKMYKTMYEKAIEENADLVVCNYVTHDGNRVLSEYKGCLHAEKLGFIKDSMFQNVSWSLVNKLFRKNCYSNICYYPSSSMGEDMVLTLQLIFDIEKISYVPQYLYYYYLNPKSITNLPTIEARINKFNQYNDNLKLVESILEDRRERAHFGRAVNWIRYSVKLYLYHPDKKIQCLRKGYYDNVEFKVLFYPEVSFQRKINSLSNIILSIFKLR